MARYRTSTVVASIVVFSTVAYAHSSARSQAKPSRLQIVVLAGEDAVNVIQQRTAVAPVVEVRDENNQPVAGALVRFTVRGKGVMIGSGNSVTVTTNAVGQAAASEISATAPGTVRIDVLATSHGQRASATITQTNYATAAQASSESNPSQGGHGKIVAVSAGALGAAGAAAYFVLNAPIQPELEYINVTPRERVGIAGATAIDVNLGNSKWKPGRTTFSINWGDGETWSGPSFDTGQHPTHTYRSAGSYTISITITDKSQLSFGDDQRHLRFVIGDIVTGNRDVNDA